MKTKSPNLTWLYLLISGLIGAIVVVAGYIAFLSFTEPSIEPETVFVQMSASDGVTEINPPIAVEDFTLTDQNGENLSLSDLEGKPVLIAWGFTHCPDICPMTLGEMRKIHEDLGAQGEDVNFLFVSVDGDRDTPAVLERYFGVLNVPFMHGMTGDPELVREIGEPLGVDFAYDEPDESGFYTVSHTAGMFLLDADGNWIRRYTYGIQRSTLVADLQEILNS